MSPTDETNDERQKLLDKAKQLREEAQTLEVQVRGSKKTSSEEPLAPKAAVVITDLKDSTWIISYRFSSQPQNDKDNQKDGEPKAVFYSGKATLWLKSDGYSELVSSTTTSPQDSNNNNIEIVKVWGWDEEYSQEDEKQYLLFSMDVQLPASDPATKLLKNGKDRFYFQARIDKSKSGAMSLADGTVTVKKDVSEKTKGMWGLFQVAGILSQFRYVGEFIAKPSSSS